MARRQTENPTAHALEEIQSFGDRIVERISANPRPVLGTLAVVLAVAAGLGIAQNARTTGADEASASFTAVRNAFLTAMGGGPGQATVPEPANPVAARHIRSDYVERFSEIATEYEGQATAALAWLEVGELQQQLEDPAAALVAWQPGLDQRGAAPLLRALLYERMAGLHEEAGRWLEAAEAYAAAGAIGDFPLRYVAMAHAARCYAEAGEREQALAVFKRIRAQAPGARLPDHVASRLRELENQPDTPTL